MKPMRLLVVLALCLTAGGAWAATPTFVPCHGCTQTAARTLAKAQIPQSWPTGTYEVYVANTPARVLWRFRVIIERDASGTFVMVRSATPEAKWLSQFRSLVDAWNGSVLASAVIDLPPDHTVRSATDVFASVIAADAVSLHINRTATGVVNAVLGAAVELTRVVFSLDYYLTVRFPDGTTARFRLDAIEISNGTLHVFRFKYIPGSARDSEGNLIPDRQNQLDHFEADPRLSYNRSLIRRQAERLNALLREAPDDQRFYIICTRSGSYPTCWIRPY